MNETNNSNKLKKVEYFKLKFLMMRIPVYLLLLLVLFSGCKSKKINNKNPIQTQSVTEQALRPVATQEEGITPIIVREENVIAVEPSVNNLLLEKYYIIMGSFRILENARKLQVQLGIEGFSAQLLQNDEGYYRVSVLSYNQISDARSKVLTIRMQYPKYHDAWVLRKLN